MVAMAMDFRSSSSISSEDYKKFVEEAERNGVKVKQPKLKTKIVVDAKVYQDQIEKKIASNIDELRDDYKKQKEENTDLKKENHKLKEELSKKNADYDSLSNDYFLLKEKSEAILEENKRLKEQNNNLLNQLKTINVDHYKSYITLLESQNNNLKKKLEQLENNNKTLEDEIVSKDSIIDNINQRVEKEKCSPPKDRFEIVLDDYMVRTGPNEFACDLFEDGYYRVRISKDKSYITFTKSNQGSLSKSKRIIITSLTEVLPYVKKQRFKVIRTSGCNFKINI